MSSSNKYFLTWEESFQSGPQRVGGKGWNLGRLVRCGFRVPKGGVLATEAYNEFVVYNGLRERIELVSQSITENNISDETAQYQLQILRADIVKGSFPPFILDQITSMLNNLDLNGKPLAVRSSASVEDSSKASFAGIHDSFLNVRHQNSLIESIKLCYSSLWSNRAVAYRRKLDINDLDVIPAIVIMEMINAKAAGVAFTCDPQTGRPDIAVINANFGLGESVVNGTVDPDVYYLDTRVWNSKPRIKDKKPGRKSAVTSLQNNEGTCLVPVRDLARKQVISDRQIEDLGLLLLRVFDSLGSGEQHQDVEWVFDGRNFVLVQARPVTKLSRPTLNGLKDQTPIWSNGNYRDAVPMVQTPLNRRLMQTIINTIHESSCTRIGYFIPEGFQFSRFFNGRLYANLSALQWIAYDSFGILPRDHQVFWGGHQPEIEIRNQNPSWHWQWIITV